VAAVRKEKKMERKPAGFWTRGAGYEIVRAYVEGNVQRAEAIARLRAAGCSETVGKTDDESIGRHLLDWYARKVRKALVGTGQARVQPPIPGAERTTIGQGGRLVIPAAYREALGLMEGNEVTLWLGEDEVHVIPSDRVLKHVQALVRRYVPAGDSLADELIAERREEARRE
jgi:AbrB family looped-hinge helix DNA binding protein